MQPIKGKQTGVIRGAVITLTVVVVMAGMAAVVAGVFSGAPALALQALSDNEMEKVAGRESIHIGIGQGFPFSGNASNLVLDPNNSTYFIEMIDRPNNAAATSAYGITYPSYAYDRYADDFALAFCNFDPTVEQTTSPLPAARILVPLEINLDVLTGSVNSKPMLDLEVFTEYTTWPANNIQPDFYFDMMSFRKNDAVAWYNDTSWEQGFELHVNGLTFLSYPYHDVDDAGVTPDGAGGNVPDGTKTPAMHITFGSDNNEQGLVGEMGMKLHLPGFTFYSLADDAATRRAFALEGILAAGNIAQTSFQAEFSYDITTMDFDGEFQIGVADSNLTPDRTIPRDTQSSPTQAVNTKLGVDATPTFFPLTISPVIEDVPGAGVGEVAFLVIEGCGSRAATVNFEVANLSHTPDAHPFYGTGGKMNTTYREYVMGDLRVGRVWSRLDRDNNSATPPTTADLGEQAVVLDAINVPYFKAVLAVDGQLGDILESANGTAMTLIRNTCMNTGAANVRFGYQNNNSALGDKVTDRPEYISWGSSGTWYTPTSSGGSYWR